MKAWIHMAIAMALVVAAAAYCAAAAGGAGASKSAEINGMWDWKVRQSRPRIWLDEGRIEWIRGKVKGKSLDEVKALAGTSTEGKALTYVLTGDTASGRAAVEAAAQTANRGSYRDAMAPAIVYDWCHDLLTADEKGAMRAALVKSMKDRMASGRTWRSFHNGLYTNSVNVGLAAIALAHDDPAADEALEFLKAQYRDVMKVYEILFPDGEWPESYDYNRVGTYQAMRFLQALKTATGCDLMASSVHIRNQTQYVAYCAKPDGLVYPGDDIDFPFLSDRDREALLFMTAEFKDRRAQHILRHCNAERFQAANYNRWRDLLWYDPALEEEPLDGLPKSKLFRGEGLVVARSGWGWDTPDSRLPVSWVTFRCGKYYGDHAHYDNGHFDIYYRGELAHDSGRYDDDWGMEREPKEIVKSQFFNYYKRAIAHNTILVYDPDEKSEDGVVNDGGQIDMLLKNGKRNAPEDYDQGDFPSDDGVGTCDWATNPGRWDTGEMLAYAGNDLFTYACGDSTKSYSPHKMKRFTRQFLFIQPNLVVTFDRVVSTKPEFRKTWLLHSINEPTVGEGGKSFELTYGEGRLVCVPVLPEKRILTKIGGPGNEFLVGGIHYACGSMASSGRFAELHYGEIPGAWRVEECPSDEAEEDYFLNVMLMTDEGSKASPAVNVVSNDAAGVTVEIGTPGGESATVTFAKGDKPAAKLKLSRAGKALFDGDMPERVVVDEARP